MSFFGSVPPPPSYSNSLTSLLPNPRPPWWFPMGLQLIQLSEHTNTICFEMFFFSTNHTTTWQLHPAITRLQSNLQPKGTLAPLVNLKVASKR